MREDYRIIPQNVDSAFRKQAFYTILAYTTYLLFGVARGFPAFLPSVLSVSESGVQITAEVKSWIASLSIFPNPLGSMMAGYLMDKYGRKTALQLSMLVFAMGWVMISYSQNLTLLYLGTIIVGLGIGIGACSVVYVTEICEAGNRCMLLSFLEPQYSLGIFIAFVFAVYLQWNVAALIFAIISAVLLFVLSWVPETPYWMAKQGRISDGIDVLQKVRNARQYTENELEFKTILMSVDDEPKQTANPITALRGNLNAFCILIASHLLLNLNGYTIILTYLDSILKSFRIEGSTNHMVAIGYSVSSFVASFLTPVAVAYWPRKTTTIVSGIGVMLSMALLALYETFLNLSEIPQFWFIVPISLYAFVFSCTVGILTLSQVMVGELCPTEVRGVMCGLTEAVGSISCGLVIKAYPLVQKYFEIDMILYFFSFFGLVTTYYGLYVLPETYGKSLSEIQNQYFRKESRLKIEQISDATEKA